MSEEYKNTENQENIENTPNTPVGYSLDGGFEELAEGKFDAREPKRAKKGIPVPVFILSMIAAMLATVMVSFTTLYGFYRAALSSAIAENTVVNNIVVDGADVEELADNIDLLKKLFETYYYYEVDEEAQFDAVLKAYVEASGDRYAQYYTSEELDALSAENAGESEGIGINVIDSTIVVSGYSYKAFKVISVTKGGPAEASGLKVGDYIFSVIDETGELVTVDSLGYDPALSMLRGKSGTEAKFLVLRDSLDGTYEQIEFSVVRAAIETISVMWHVCETDASVGIVKITGFDLTTPTQFTDAVDSLVDQGIEKIVFDLRYNPGGDLASIVAVLSYFVERGDIIISASDKDGYTEYITAQPENGYTGAYSSCNVSKADLGKYKDLDVAVICNESTASAAELFVANFRDHGIGEVVGTTTYGKGSMQSIVDLSAYGFEGGLRFTTRVYFPPSGESYDGIGIEPDVVVELDEALYSKNIYEITDAEDNQLQAAIKTLN